MQELSYSDSVFLLDFIIQVWGEEKIFKNESTKAQLIDFEANIQNATENHFEEQKNLQFHLFRNIYLGRMFRFKAVYIVLDRSLFPSSR